MITPLLPEHHEGCIAVIKSLPEWFGYEGAIENISKALETHQGFVATDNDMVMGFVVTTPAFAESLEITYLAVSRSQRRQGFGQQLVRAVRDLAIETDAQAICLLTLGPSANDENYAQTVAFYQAIGFWRTKESRLTDWGGTPSLLMSAPVQNLRFIGD